MGISGDLWVQGRKRRISQTRDAVGYRTGRTDGLSRSNLRVPLEGVHWPMEDGDCHPRLARERFRPGGVARSTPCLRAAAVMLYHPWSGSNAAHSGLVTHG